MLKHFDLEAKYESIGNGTHIKYFDLLKNQFNYQTIGFIDVFPKELYSHFSVDYKDMFNKTVCKSIEQLYECLNWTVPSITSARTTDLFELFS